MCPGSLYGPQGTFSDWYLLELDHPNLVFVCSQDQVNNQSSNRIGIFTMECWSLEYWMTHGIAFVGSLTVFRLSLRYKRTDTCR